jgi:glutamine---fructose-6-phosphate transaminase (isomerizing)
MSQMAREAAEAPQAVARFLQHNKQALAELGRRLRGTPPPVVLTGARGSSDNAAGYFKYLTEILLGVPCCSVGASVVSVYGAQLNVHGALAVTISQSGKSPDILALQREVRRSGALAVAVVNDEASPAARDADMVLSLCAGPETSVAATKSFIVSLVAGAAIVASWREDAALSKAIAGLPDALEKAVALQWPEFVDTAAAAKSLLVLGRGPSLPIAAEAALKLKETSAIHAEAISLAEVMHGPLELLGNGLPVLVFSPEDRSRAAAIEAIGRIRKTGAKVMVVGPGGLASAPSGHPLLEPISMILTAYFAIEKVARARGRDPDRPRLLKKVTETL